MRLNIVGSFKKENEILNIFLKYFHSTWPPRGGGGGSAVEAKCRWKLPWMEGFVFWARGTWEWLESGLEM